jgi:hypothetical protein
LLAIAPTTARADSEVEALAIATGVIIATAIAAPTREESSQIVFEAGRLDPVKNVQQATAFGAEYRWGNRLWWKLRPFVGAGFTSQHSFYGYGGIRVSAHWGERLVVTPSFAIGGYSRGAGKDLGNPAVIGRFGIDLEYRFDNDTRVGVGYHHISNGKAFNQSTNPGTEVVGLTLSLALP